MWNKLSFRQKLLTSLVTSLSSSAASRLSLCSQTLDELMQSCDRVWATVLIKHGTILCDHASRSRGKQLLEALESIIFSLQTNCSRLKRQRAEITSPLHNFLIAFLDCWVNNNNLWGLNSSCPRHTVQSSIYSPPLHSMQLHKVSQTKRVWKCYSQTFSVEQNIFQIISRKYVELLTKLSLIMGSSECREKVS